MDSEQIRKKFVDFFQKRGHKVIPSLSLVPHGDPTLLFTSAGMVQFKPYFMGQAEPPARRMVSVQKCFRTSDIDSVGDADHLTFFEMLGNFSVGDYFKKGAIEWAWELVTDKKEGIGLDPDKLWVSVFLDDDEAFDHWRELGVPEERIMRYGEEDNYWFSGDVGPCGPCSEIHYDFGLTEGCPECEKGTCHPAVDCGRFTELWNLVFTTYYLNEDGSRSDLPQKNIDTGAGLERWACVLQDKRTVYETDLFRPIIELIQDLSKVGPERDKERSSMSGEKNDSGVPVYRSKRIIAEHTRAATFLIADGVTPSNDGRGYVLRRILRRAVAYGRRLALNRPFLSDIASALVKLYGTQYPELVQKGEFIAKVIGLEEERFRETMERGLSILEGMLRFRESHSGALQEVIDFIKERRPAAENAARILEEHGFSLPSAGDTYYLMGAELAAQAVTDATSDVAAGLEKPQRGRVPREAQQAVNRLLDWEKSVTGYEAFVFQDTYGFPVELTAELAGEQGVEIDLEGFQREMEAQRERARAARRDALIHAETARAEARALPPEIVTTRFVGYETLRHETTVAGIIAGKGTVDSAQEGDEAGVVLHETPFYAEAGGEVGDVGEIMGPNGLFQVEDTQRTESGLILHRGRVVEGRIAVNDDVVAQVDDEKCHDTMRNHTATHLLHAALRRVLGPHARQAGSLVSPERLRFDFTHIEALKPDELTAIQRVVNEKIRENVPVGTRRTSYEEATAGGAIALFDEKYAAEVRVVEVTDEEQGERYSAELCGGKHVHATGDIGTFIIVSEESVGAGMRRIEALTGRGADEYIGARMAALDRLGRRLAVSGGPPEVEQRMESLLGEMESLKKRVQTLERELGRHTAQSLSKEAENVNGRAVVAARVPPASAETLRDMGDWLRDRLGSAVVVLGTVVEGRPSFLAMITSDLTERGLHAGKLIKKVAQVTGGGGGGRPGMAQAGGKDAGRLDEALRLARKLAVEGIRGLKDS